MFSELVELGEQLEEEGKLPSAGYYSYSKTFAVKWIVHVFSDHVTISGPTELHPWRPFSGRSSGRESHILADEAGYCLGISLIRRDAAVGEEQHDEAAAEKHTLFRDLYQQFLESDELEDPDLRRAIELLNRAFDDGWIKPELATHQDILYKDWVSFVVEEGPLKGEHLFEHTDVKAFWVEEMKRRTVQSAGNPPVYVRGVCSVCAQPNRMLLRKLPLKVKLVNPVPLHSLNKNAFVSYMSGSDAFENAHLGLCFECGDTAARAFNYLSDSRQHKIQLVRQPKKPDSLANQYAIFWLKAPVPLQVGEQVLDLSDPTDIRLDSALHSNVPDADLSQLQLLLEQPWKPRDSAFRLDDYGFYLALLSPNKGRIAVRDWMAVDISTMKQSLRKFLEATRMVSPWGDVVSPVSLAAIVEAIDAQSADLTRALLRTAYTGVAPPSSLAILAGQRLNRLLATEQSLKQRQQRTNPRSQDVWNESWLRALAAAFKLGLFWGSEEAKTMSELNPLYRSVAYQSGRLLAALDRAQQIYAKEQTGDWPDTTSIQRAYGGAAENPNTVIGQILKTSTPAHLPKAGRRINYLVEDIQALIAEQGGMKEPLSAREQGDFGTGFYHQRAELRASRQADGKTDEGKGDGNVH